MPSTDGGPEVVRLDDVRRVHDLIRPHVLRTPLVSTPSGIRLKAESLQPVGSFKLRGAFGTVLQLDPATRRRGIVAHSSGNHALAVAYVGRALAIRAVVVVPSDAPVIKVDRARALGAEIVVVGPASAERAERATELAVAEGLYPVVPYDSPRIVEATGTIGVEIVEDLGVPEGSTWSLYVPISGGGLAAGVAMAAKALDPAVRVIGVEPELAADALASWRAGRVVSLPAEDMARTAADGLRVQQVGAICWPYLQAHLDDIVTVSEDQIREAARCIAADAGLVAEPSGAVAPAAAFTGSGSPDIPPAHRIAVLTGRNTELVPGGPPPD